MSQHFYCHSNPLSTLACDFALLAAYLKAVPVHFKLILLFIRQYKKVDLFSKLVVRDRYNSAGHKRPDGHLLRLHALIVQRRHNRIAADVREPIVLDRLLMYDNRPPDDALVRTEQRQVRTVEVDLELAVLLHLDVTNLYAIVPVRSGM